MWQNNFAIDITVRQSELNNKVNLFKVYGTEDSDILS